MLDPSHEDLATMGLRLNCPNCGSRPHTEFWFGGELELHGQPAPEAATAAPVAPESAAHEADFARVWLRQNSYGVQHERWFHHAGCRRWHTAVRNTLTNEIHASS
jgi:heterotetrameric sarcosine oxidase delta subunit